MSAEWSITSPVALLNQWQGPAARDDLQDLVLLGFTVNLPFLEKVAIRTARDLGARVTVIGDAAHGVHDPVDVGCGPTSRPGRPAGARFTPSWRC